MFGANELGDTVPPVVQYPEMRANVVASLKSLSDRDWQQRVWLTREPIPPPCDTFDTVVHILYDDMRVLPDPRQMVGTVLRPSEVDPMLALEDVLGPLLNELGDLTDREYVEHPTWPKVVEAARAAHAAMRDPEHGST